MRSPCRRWESAPLSISSTSTRRSIGQDWAAPIGSEAAGAARLQGRMDSQRYRRGFGEIEAESPALHHTIVAAGFTHGHSMQSYLTIHGDQAPRDASRVRWRKPPDPSICSWSRYVRHRRLGPSHWTGRSKACRCATSGRQLRSRGRGHALHPRFVDKPRVERTYVRSKGAQFRDLAELRDAARRGRSRWRGNASHDPHARSRSSRRRSARCIWDARELGPMCQYALYGAVGALGAHYHRGALIVAKDAPPTATRESAPTRCAAWQAAARGPTQPPGAFADWLFNGELSAGPSCCVAERYSPARSTPLPPRARGPLTCAAAVLVPSEEHGARRSRSPACPDGADRTHDDRHDREKPQAAGAVGCPSRSDGLTDGRASCRRRRVSPGRHCASARPASSSGCRLEDLVQVRSRGASSLREHVARWRPRQALGRRRAHGARDASWRLAPPRRTSAIGIRAWSPTSERILLRRAHGVGQNLVLVLQQDSATRGLQGWAAVTVGLDWTATHRATRWTVWSSGASAQATDRPPTVAGVRSPSRVVASPEVVVFPRQVALKPTRKHPRLTTPSCYAPIRHRSASHHRPPWCAPRQR